MAQQVRISGSTLCSSVENTSNPLAMKLLPVVTTREKYVRPNPEAGDRVRSCLHFVLGAKLFKTF